RGADRDVRPHPGHGPRRDPGRLCAGAVRPGGHPARRHVGRRQGRRGMRGHTARARMLVLQYAPLLLFLVLLAVFGSLSERFLTPVNFINIVTQAAHIAIIAIGMTFVLLVAGIDLSVGANMYVSCIVVALYMKGWNPAFGFLVAGTQGLAF